MVMISTNLALMKIEFILFHSQRGDLLNPATDEFCLVM
jgi:hypothetical protein